MKIKKYSATGGMKRHSTNGGDYKGYLYRDVFIYKDDGRWNATLTNGQNVVYDDIGSIRYLIDQSLREGVGA
jgi:hypothetical protein